MKHAVIAIEDKRFYEHDGVDLRGVARAFVQDVIQRKAAQGASTIPQQFVKNALQAQAERTVFQKLRESAMAFHLSRKWSKEKILTEYLNAIYFGNGAYGIESAARTYFGKEPGHLGCGTEDAPVREGARAGRGGAARRRHRLAERLRPGQPPGRAEQRRNLVLQRMIEQALHHARRVPRRDPGEPADEHLAAARGGQDARPRRTSRPGSSSRSSTATAPRRAFTGGLRISTTLDLELQRAAEATIKQWLGDRRPARPPRWSRSTTRPARSARWSAAATTTRRRSTSPPRASASRARRSSRSSSPPRCSSGIGPGSTWTSKKQKITSKAYGCDFEVNNYEDAYAGVTTLASATTFSDNAVYAQVGLKVGLKKIAQTARRMGIRTPISRNCAMTLGGLREGVTPLDMAHAYQTFATGGQFVTGSLGPPRGPVGIREVCRRIGDDDDASSTATRSASSACCPRASRRRRTRSSRRSSRSGTAVRARLDEFAAGKTGTTENYGDAWFVGYTEADDRRGVGRLPGQVQADGDRVPRRAGRRRHVPGGDLARLHGRRRQDRRRPREQGAGRRRACRRATTTRARRRRRPARRPTPGYADRPAAGGARRRPAATRGPRRRPRPPSPSRRRRRSPQPAPEPAPAPDAGPRARRAAARRAGGDAAAAAG